MQQPENYNLWDQINGIPEPEPVPEPEPISEPETVTEEPPAEQPVPAPQKKKTTRRWLIPTIAAVLALSIGLTLLFTLRKPPKPQPEQLVSVWLMAESESTGGDGVIPSHRTYTYDENGNLLQSISYVDGNEVSRNTNTYDEDGNLLEQISSIDGIESHRESYTWDFEGNLTGYTRSGDGIKPNSYTYTYGWNGKLSEVRIVDSRNTTTIKRLYDSRGNMIRETGSAGGKEIFRKEYSFDDANRLLSQVEYRGGEQDIVVLYGYNPDGTLAMKQFQSTEYSEHFLCFYDSDGNLIRKNYYCDGEHLNSIVYAYDDAGRQTQEICFEGETENYSYFYIYDDQGRKVEERYSDGDYQHTTRTIYNDAGDPLEQISVVNGKTSVVRYTYDEHGNSISYEIWSGDTLKSKSTQTFVEVRVSPQRAEELKKTQGRPQVSVEYTFGYYGDDGFIPS